MDIDAYLYAAGNANKGRCYGLGSQLITGARRFPVCLPSGRGFSHRPASPHSIDSDHSSHIPHKNDDIQCRPDALKESERRQETRVHERVKQAEERERRVEEQEAAMTRQVELQEVEIERRMAAATATLREELLEQFGSTSSGVDPEHIKQAMHAAMQREMETMRREIFEMLRESERRVRAERRKENRERDESIVRRVLELVRADVGERDDDSDDDDSLPPRT